MAVTRDGLNDLVQKCVLAGCTDRQIRGIILEATGHTQEQIAEELDVQPPAVSKLLSRAHERLEAGAPVRGFDLERVMRGWVFDDDTCFFGHPMTVPGQTPRAAPPPRLRRGKAGGDTTDGAALDGIPQPVVD